MDEEIGGVTGFDEVRVDFETLGARVEGGRGTGLEGVGEGVVVVGVGVRVGKHLVVEMKEVIL